MATSSQKSAAPPASSAADQSAAPPASSAAGQSTAAPPASSTADQSTAAPLLPALTLRSIASRTTVDEFGATFTMYAMALTAADGREWAVERRFSEFRKLEARLRASWIARGAAPPPAMPAGLGGSTASWLSDTATNLSPSTAAWFSGTTANLNPALVSQRVLGLDAYLRSLFAVVPPTDAVLADFLLPEGPGQSSTPVPKDKGFDPKKQARAAEVSRKMFAPLPPLKWELIYENTNEVSDEGFFGETYPGGWSGDEAAEGSDAGSSAAEPPPRWRGFFLGVRLWCEPSAHLIPAGLASPLSETGDSFWVLGRVLARRVRNEVDELRVRMLHEKVIGGWLKAQTTHPDSAENLSLKVPCAPKSG